MIRVFQQGVGGGGGARKYIFDKVFSEDNPYWYAMANMPTGRYGIASSAVGNKIYAIGGNASSKNECYDTLTNTWSTKANMITGRDYASSSAVGDKIYAIGGDISPNNQNECCDIYALSFKFSLFGKNTIRFDKKTKINDKEIPAITETEIDAGNGMDIIFINPDTSGYVQELDTEVTITN